MESSINTKQPKPKAKAGSPSSKNLVYIIKPPYPGKEREEEQSPY
jgi:hypothetical protein